MPDERLIFGFNMWEFIILALGTLIVAFVIIGSDIKQPTQVLVPSSSATTSTVRAITSTTEAIINYTIVDYNNMQPKRGLTTTTTSTLLAVTTSLPITEMQTLDKVTLQKIYNMRPDNSQSPIYQAGFFQAKKDFEVLVGLKPPKYNEGPAFNSWPVQNNVSSDINYCFLKQSGSDYSLYGLEHNSGFMLNGSMWNWTAVNETVLHSKLLYFYNDTVNETQARPDFWVETVWNGNLWVQRL